MSVDEDGPRVVAGKRNVNLVAPLVSPQIWCWASVARIRNQPCHNHRGMLSITLLETHAAEARIMHALKVLRLYDTQIWEQWSSSLQGDRPVWKL